MKRSLAILLCLLIIGSAAAGGFSLSLIDSADDLEFTEDIIYGDPKELEGLNVRFTSSVSRFLDYWPRLGSFYWTTEACFDEGRVIAETEQKYSFVRERNEVPERVDIRATMSFSDNYDLMHPGLLENIREKYSKEFENKELISVVMPLKDIYTQYPLDFAVLGDYTVSPFSMASSNTAQNEAAFQKKAEEYFKFPIADDIKASLTIPKTGRTRVDILSGYSFERAMNIKKYGSFSTGDKIYFFFEAQTVGGIESTRYDYSLVPGGYGVYSVGIHYEDRALVIDAESLTTLCSFGDETSIEALSSSKDGNVIYVFAKENDEHKVYAVDAKTGEKLQKLSICGADASQCLIQKEEGYHLFGIRETYSEREEKGVIYVLEEDERGFLSITLKADIGEVTKGRNIHELLEYGQWINSEYGVGYSQYYNSVGLCNAYRDGKLYIASPDINGNSDSPEYISRCGIAVAVFGKDGPLFFGNYKSSIDGTSCEPQRYIKPEIRFE